MKCISLIFIFIISDIDFLYAKTTQQLDCRKIAYQVEKDLNIPNKLLVSIALTESGTTNSLGNFVAWPWTLNVNGQPYFFKNKDKAYNFLLKKIGEGEKNIDIGCMQISYKYHRKNFQNLKSFLDPNNNVIYAAKYLKNLHKREKSWNKAISYYHSSNPQRMFKYLDKVHRNWKHERQTDYHKNEVLAFKENTKIKQPNQIDDPTRKKIEFFRKEFEESRLDHM